MSESTWEELWEARWSEEQLKTLNPPTGGSAASILKAVHFTRPAGVLLIGVVLDGGGGARSWLPWRAGLKHWSPWVAKAAVWSLEKAGYEVVR